MKRQQETMALQRKAGVNPLSGCIPALIQMPVFFALFRFFPANIDIRQHGFLWADDLSAYDEVLKLPFKIPFYGDHVSLFPILASVAIFFYMQMTQSQQMSMQQPQQEGMPDMQKMMKMMMWFSPIMMMFFGAISSLRSSGTCCRRQRFRRAMAIDRLALSCPMMYLSSSATISDGLR